MTGYDPSMSEFYGIPRATLQVWLSDAQQAYYDLMVGGKPVSVAYDGKSVTYIAADASRLQSLIQSLQRQLGLNHGRRAMRPLFR